MEAIFKKKKICDSGFKNSNLVIIVVASVVLLFRLICFFFFFFFSCESFQDGLKLMCGLGPGTRFSRFNWSRELINFCSNQSRLNEEWAK